MFTNSTRSWSTKLLAATLAYVTTLTSAWAIAPPLEQDPNLLTHWTTVPPVKSEAQKTFDKHLADQDRALSELRHQTASQKTSNNTKSAHSGAHYFNNFASLTAPTFLADGDDHRHDGDNDNDDQGSSNQQSAGVVFYGPQQFVRSNGSKNVYTVEVDLPSWIGNADTMHIQNGDTAGCDRDESSATVVLNGKIIASQSDFNEHVSSIDRSVTLQAKNTLVVTLASKPGSFLTISISGPSLDHTAPQVTIVSPAAYVNTATPHFDIRYQDVVGSNEPGASGVTSVTFKSAIDGVDRTSLFTIHSDEATATLPSNLALSAGPHKLVVTVQDAAGNTGTASATFTVDLTRPSIQFVQPAAGAYLNTRAPAITLAFSDNAALNLSSLQVLINGKNQTSLFTVTGTGASTTLTTATQLPVGANQITASIADQAGNTSSASLAFNVDTQSPTLKVITPAANATLTSSSVAFDVQYSDDQALNLSSFGATLDGAPLTLTVGATDAKATLTVANGTHTLKASISDKAGNQATVSSSFTVNTSSTAPTITVATPATGALLNQSSPAVEIDYSGTGITTSSLKVTINGTDRTSLFTVTATKATVNLTGQLVLPEGSNTIAVQISNSGGKTGNASSTFTVDTVAPTVQFVAPAALVNSQSPVATIQFSDATSGVDPGTVKITLDGQDVTSAFAISAASATGTLSGLADGAHTLQVVVSDRAKNATTKSFNFTVDTAAPTGAFTAPANNGFVNTPNPAISLTFGDGSGSGVDVSSLHVYLQQGSNPAAEITVSLTVTSNSATGSLSGLADGTYRLQATFSDKAGNAAAPVTEVFSVDTVRPTYTLLAPAPSSNVSTSSPKLELTYSDNAGGSGLDLSRLKLTIDGTDFTSRLTNVTSTEATGQLLPGDALSDGTHQVVVTLYDKAGNQATATPQSFIVDTKAPQLLMTAPVSGSWEGKGSVPFSISWSDAGSGVNPNSLQVLVDTVDETSKLTTSLAGASGTLTVPVTGTVTVHSIVVTISDNAGNVATANAGVNEDPQGPVVSVTSPASGSYTNQPSITISGTINDADPQLNVQCAVGSVPGVAGTITPGSPTQFSCKVALASGSNAVTITVSDTAGLSTPVPLTVILDTMPPVVTYAIAPPPNAAGWNNSNATVTFTCVDADSGVATCPGPVTVTTEGANQKVSATATDKAGNSQPVTVTLNIDKTPPVITASANPPANAAGWNNSNVTVTWQCSDLLSGVGTSCPAPQTVTTEGANQLIAQTVTDIAGNISAPASVQLSIEKIAPSMSYTLSPAANAAGWNNSPVTVNFVCGASASASLPAAVPSITVSTEGKNQQVSQTCTDPAGNTGKATATVNLDLTAPVITGAVLPAPNGNGWNTTPVTVNWMCSDSLSGIAAGGCPQSSPVTQDGKGQNVTASVADAAGNIATGSVTVNLEQAGTPSITSQIVPAPNAAGWNNANPTVNFVCTPSVADIVSCTSPVNVITEGANQSIPGSVTDAAGRTANTSATVSLDKTPPVITAVAAPPANAAGWNNSNVTISYTCADSLSGVALCPPAQSVSSEGAQQVFTQTVVDVAGNISVPATVKLSIDKTPPTITPIVNPAANGAGWNNSPVTVTWQCADSISGIASCPGANTFASEGANQTVSGTATDIAGNAATASPISVSIDETAPSITLNTPASLSPSASGQVTASLSDALSGVVSLTLALNGTSLGTFASGPYQANFTVPASTQPGDTLTITAVAMDAAGNTATASRGITVVANGVVAGQVLDDATGHPIVNATVQVVGQSNQNAVTDSNGRYSLPVTGQQLFLTVTLPPDPNATTPVVNTTIDRQVSVQNGQGNVPVDARLTAIATPVSAASDGSATLTASGTTVTLPAGSVAAGTPLHLTPLTGQGLPNLLPLGWTPIAAFDLRADSGTPNNAVANFTSLPQGTVHLVSYNYSQHFWAMVAPSLAVNADGTLPAQPLTGPGTYALTMADAADSAGNPVPVPGPGQPLTGVTMVTLDASAVTTGKLATPALGPQGGTDAATFNVQSAIGLPSGTVVQAQVTETYQLANNTQVSIPSRTQDLVVYRLPNGDGTQMIGTLPLTATQTYTPQQFISGNIHVDMLAGRESVRGEAAGSDAAVVQDGDVTVSIAAGSLPKDTDISVSENSLPSFLPQSNLLTPVVDLTLDTTDATLSNAAQVSIANQNIPAGTNLVIAYVPRRNGVPYLTVVSLAQSDGVNVTTLAYPGLPGMVQPGEYVVMQVSQPLGFIGGNLSANNSTVQGMVQTDGLPFVSFSSPTGNYLVAAVAGTVNLSASVLGTALAGTATGNAIAGQTTNTDITLTGTVNSATVNPPDGSIGFSTSGTIVVTSPVALNAQSVTPAAVQLFQGAVADNNPVAIRLQLNTAGTQFTVLPQQLLQAGTKYTLQVTSLADVNGGVVNVPTSAFTTAEATQTTYNSNALTFSFPDQNGNVQITAPAGSFQAGTKIQVVDLSSGVVLVFTVATDGSASNQILATTSDIMQITITDPLGGVNTFTKSQYVAADGTTAIGPGGGTVTGPGGVGLIIPAGALTSAATFKIDAFGADMFSERPILTGGTFGGGLHITTSGSPLFNKEVKLAFPKPVDAPDGAFYYIYRRMPGPNGIVAFQTLDHAFVQGYGANAQIVSASYPFSGLMDNLALYTIDPTGGIVLSLAEEYEVLMWTYSQALPGKALPGVITGKVQYPVAPGTPDINGVVNTSNSTIYEPVPGAIVSGVDPRGNALFNTATNQNFAISQADGTYTLWDMNYAGGTVGIMAQAPSVIPGVSSPPPMVPNVATAVAVESTVLTDKTVLGQLVGPLLPYYKNIAVGNILFNSFKRKAPTPQIGISIMTLDQAGNRQLVNSPILAGTSLLFGFSSNSGDPNVSFVVTAANVDGSQYVVVSDSSTQKLQFNGGVTTSPFVPAIPGTYTITATAPDPFGGTLVTASVTFLVIAPGGTNSQVSSGPPDIVTDLLKPKPNSTTVSVDILPQIVFSEPVQHVAVSVSLTEIQLKDGTQCTPTDTTPVPVNVYGVGVDVNSDGTIGNPDTFNPLVDGPNVAVTSVTLQPTSALKFNTNYMITVSHGITDLYPDSNGKPAPRNLANTPPDRSFCFHTFTPTGLTDQQINPSPGLVVIGNSVYTAQNYDGSNTQLIEYDASDPGNLQLVDSATQLIAGRASDIVGQENSPLLSTGGGLVAVSTGFGTVSLPSNITVYDVSIPEQPKRVAAFSATNSAANSGSVLRMALKDQFIYAAVLMQGIEVLDLNQAMTDLAAANATYFVGLTTDGMGAGLDSVVNTIPVISHNFFGSTLPATLYSVKAAGFQIAGLNKTLVAATGTTAFVIADPSIGGQVSSSQSSPAILAQLDTITTSVGTFQLGEGLALGQLTGSFVPGNPSQTPVAVLVGIGAPTGGGAAVPMMTILNLTDPTDISSVQPMGSMLLPTSLPDGTSIGVPTDVVLDNNLAIVGYNAAVALIDLSDPSNLELTGFVRTSNPTGSSSVTIGGRLALNSDELLFSTSPSQPTVSVAAFKNILLIAPIDPILAQDQTQYVPKASYQQVQQPQPTMITSQTLVDGTITLRFVPPPLVPLTAAISIQKTDHSEVAKGSVALDPNSGFGTFTLPAGLTLTDGALTVFAQATDDQGNAVIAKSKQAPIATLMLTIDSNNDTNVDVADRAVRNTQVFRFWDYDTVRELPTAVQNGLGYTKYVPNNVIDDFTLADYATVRLTITTPLKKGNLGLVLTDALSNNGVAQTYAPSNIAWGLSDRVTMPGMVGQPEHDHDYLMSEAQQQISTLKAGCLSTSRPANQAVPVGGNCESTYDGYGNVINVTGLNAGDNYFLMACRTCDTTIQDQPNTRLLSGKLRLEVRYYPNGFAATTTPALSIPVDSSFVDIRPIEKWMTVYTVLQPADRISMLSLTDRPLANAVLSPTWGSSGPETIPQDAKKITVILHGYNVTSFEAETESGGNPGFFKTYFKRLYWVGHPVMGTIPVGQKDEGRSVYTYGFTWPGSTVYRTNSGIIQNALQAMGIHSAMRPLIFQEDVFRALESGVPIAKKLAEIKKAQTDPTNEMYVIAHSLGNMVVNSALDRGLVDGIMAPGTITRYIMNEAAVSADTMSSANNMPEISQLLTAHAGFNGWPDDNLPWKQLWGGSTGVALLLPTTVNDPWYETMDDSRVQVLNGERPRYCWRWQQTRLFADGVHDDGVGTFAPASDATKNQECNSGDAGLVNSYPHRGSWVGFFQNNLTQNGTRIFNTYNANDGVLGPIWMASELTQKPGSGIFGNDVTQIQEGLDLAHELMEAGEATSEGLGAVQIVKLGKSIWDWYRMAKESAEFWAFLKHTESTENYVFAAPDGHDNIIRQWAELAYFFNSLSTPIGRDVMPNLVNFNFGTFGPDGIGAFAAAPVPDFGTIFDSHSYMQNLTFSKTWCGYVTYRRIMNGDYDDTGSYPLGSNVAIDPNKSGTDPVNCSN